MNPIDIFTVFSLNCWGIPMISKNRLARIEAIAEHLSENIYDFVSLQEVWSNDDYEFLKEEIGSKYAYAHYFHSGVIGSGLCIFSKHPIRETLFHQWSVNGYCHKIQHGDWFGGKGVGLCRIDFNGININLYTVHLHAEYDKNNDEYLAHRVVQAFDTAQFVKLTSAPNDIVLLGGDLNTEPEDLAFRIISNTAELNDAFNHGNPSEECNATNECHRNTYRNRKYSPKRIDYILFRAPKEKYLRVLNYEMPLPPVIPGRSFSFSDHEAIAAKFQLTDVQDSNYDSFHAEDALSEGIKICDGALLFLKDHRNSYIACAVVTAILLIIIHYILPHLFSYNFTSVFIPYVSPIIHLIGIAFLFFAIFMATIWNSMEINGILAGKLSMEKTLSLSK